MLTGLWDLKDLLNSRQYFSKNKLVRENAVTRVHGSCSLRVMVSWRNPFFHSCRLEKCQSLFQSLSASHLFFQSLVTVGAMIGSCIGGWLIDKFGRKGSILMSAVPFELGWLLISFAKNHAMLYAGRIITGLACGVVSLAVPVSRS